MNKEENVEIFADSAALTADYLLGLKLLSQNFNLAQLVDPQIEPLARWFCREALKLAHQEAGWLGLTDQTDLALAQELHQADKVRAMRCETAALYVADKIVCAELRWREACHQLRQVCPALHTKLGLVDDAYLAQKVAQQQTMQRIRIGWVPKYLRHFADTVLDSRPRPEDHQEVAAAFERAITELYDWTGRAYPRVDKIDTASFCWQARQDLSNYLAWIAEYRRRLDDDFAKCVRIDNFSTILDRAASQRWHIKLLR